jgi:hypothetical protein
MAESAQQSGKLNVFISYSRKDLDFADQLRVALQGFGFGVTIDRDDITGGDAWEKQLTDLIRDADTVVFVLSPSSADSRTCAWEVKQAVDGGKRILPVLCRALDGANPLPELAALNYMYFYPEPKFPGSGFGKGLVELATALNTDSNWLREHTRYLRLAREWDEVGKPADRRLLSAADIALAKTWAGDRPSKAPELTPLQVDFIKASEAEDIRRQSAETQRLREIAQAQDERVRALAEREKALEREADAQGRESEARKREAEQVKRVARRTLIGALVAGALAIAAVAFAWYAQTERTIADDAARKAAAAADEADRQRKIAERQLDRASQALAESIDNDLGLKPYETLTPRQRQALWRLAVADKPIKRNFMSILANSPEETNRVSPGIPWIARALGLLEASQALDLVLKQMGPVTDPWAFQQLAQALHALADRLSEPQARPALDIVLKQMGRWWDYSYLLQALAEALQALPAKPSEAQAGRALDLVLKQIGPVTDPSAFLYLVQALQALPAKLTEAQTSQTLDLVLKKVDQTTDPFQLPTLMQALQALPAKLTEAQASQALDPILKQMSLTTDPAALRALGEALQPLAPMLNEAQASQALDPVLKQIGQTTDAVTRQALARALQALAAELTEAQASKALDLVLKQIGHPSDVYAYEPLGQALQALAAVLTEPQASQALDSVLEQIGQATYPEALRALAQALKALPVKLSEVQASQALDPVVKQIDQTTNPYDLRALAQALQALPAELTEAPASQALDRVLKQIDHTVSNPPWTDASADRLVLLQLAQALQALPAKLSEAQAVQASKVASTSLAWAGDDKEAAEWARALVTLSQAASNRDGMLVNAITYPAAGGSATEVLLDAIRAGRPDAPAKEAGTEAGLEWLAKTYPNVLRPPVCPQPLQSDLKCPRSAGQQD